MTESENQLIQHIALYLVSPRDYILMGNKKMKYDMCEWNIPARRAMASVMGPVKSQRNVRQVLKRTLKPWLQLVGAKAATEFQGETVRRCMFSKL